MKAPPRALLQFDGSALEKDRKPRHMCALYTVWYNFARINSAVKMAPAMVAGISKTLWDVADIVKLVEDYEASDRVAA